jgi:hypothetical protein
MDAYTHDGWLAVEHNSILTKLSTPQKFELLVKMKEARACIRVRARVVVWA